MRTRIVVLLTGLVATAPLCAALTVEFVDGQITASGVSPGGSVALVAVAKTARTYYSETTFVRELLADRDIDGTVSYALDGEVPARSIWAFVDLSTGEHAVAAPEEGVGTEVPFPFEESLRDGSDGDYVLVEDRRTAVEVLYVRPRVGSWCAFARDGSPTDRDDSSDGRVAVHLADLEELGEGTRTLDDVLAGDVFLGIDPYIGKYFVHTVGETPRR